MGENYSIIDELQKQYSMATNQAVENIKNGIGNSEKLKQLSECYTKTCDAFMQLTIFSVVNVANASADKVVDLKKNTEILIQTFLDVQAKFQKIYMQIMISTNDDINTLLYINAYD